MNIRKSLIHDRSKANCQEIVAYLQQNPESLMEYMACLLADDKHLSQQAAWAVHFITDNCPDLLAEFESDLLNKMQGFSNHDAYNRAILRHWSITGFSAENEGLIYDIAFKVLEEANPVAVKAHAMSVCLRVVQAYPELALEFQAILTKVLAKYASQSNAIKSRGQKILRQLEPIVAKIDLRQ